MALTFNFPLNQITGFPIEENRVVNDAYLVIEPSSISLSGVPQIRGNVHYSKALYEAGGNAPIYSNSFYFAVIINPQDGKTYAVNMENPNIAVPFQAKEDGVVDIESTAYLYLQALLGGVIE
jgi:hypothetical protein